MPVISFNVSESLRKAIKKLVKGNLYKNNSSVMRDALTRLMDSYSETDVFLAGVDGTSDAEIIETISGNIMIITDRYNEFVEKKLSKIETDWSNYIKAKHAVVQAPYKTIVYFFEGPIESFHEFIVLFNKIEDLKNIRYVIL